MGSTNKKRRPLQTHAQIKTHRHSVVKNAVTHFAAAVFLYTYPAIAPTFFSFGSRRYGVHEQETPPSADPCTNSREKYSNKLVWSTSLFEYFSREFVHGSAEGGVSCSWTP
jgi:hypothetical protein